jgi:hypothetical protein
VTPRPLSAAFDRLAHLRGARAFHPAGRVGTGRIRIERPDAALAAALGTETHPVQVRLSRGIGLPPRWPDLLGLAVRIERADPMDLLLTTTVGGRLGRYVVAPARRWTSRVYSTVQPHRAPAGRVVIGVRAAGAGLQDGSLDALDGVGVAGPVSFDVLEARGLRRWRRVGRLELDRVGDDAAVAFDPVLHADDRLRPTRLLAEVREAAYRGSRRGRPGAGTG